MKCPKCGKHMEPFVFLFICYDCELMLSKQEIKDLKKEIKNE